MSNIPAAPWPATDRSARLATAGHLQALDGLRGVAALAVVFSHSSFLILDSLRTRGLPAVAMRASIGAGHPAVILFFVLSGFVLYLAFQRGPAPYGIYLVRRVLRIYPALLAALVLAFVLRLVVIPGPVAGFGPWTTAGWTPVDAAGLLRNALLLGLVRSDSALDPVLWSLVVEMRFSILFPLLAMLCRASRWALVGLSLVAHVVGIVLLHRLGLSTRFLFFGVTPLGAVAVVLFYLPCFGFGIAAADWYLAQPRRPVATRAVEAAVLAGLAVAAATGIDLVWALATTALIYIACQPGLIGDAARRPVCLFLGRISYSLYLVHAPVLMAVVRVLHPQVPLAVTAFVISPALSIGLAMLSYRYVELPGIAAGKRIAGWLAPRRARTA